MAKYDDELRMTSVYSPPRYSNTTAGAVRYAPITVQGRVVAYLWAAVDNDAVAVIDRIDVGPDGFNTAVAWFKRLRDSKAQGLTPSEAFDHWRRHGAEDCTIGEVQHAPSLQALHRIAGRDLEAERRQEEAEKREWQTRQAARSGPPDEATKQFLQVQAALRTAPDFPAPNPGLDERIRLIDEVLRVKPVPEDLWGWWATDARAFQGDLAGLPGTNHVELGYLEVALVRHKALAGAEVVVHVRVPTGTPGIYLNLFDETKRLQAPTMLLARGLTLAIHAAEQRDGQWRLEAEILPMRATGPTRGMPPG
jgi:hypothetical protein